MSRTYELVFIIEPRLSDEEVVGISDDFKELITTGGGKVIKEESWGKRKLAYMIGKATEGRYVLLGIETDGENPLPEVERRMRQNENILRFLTIRIDNINMPAPAVEAS